MAYPFILDVEGYPGQIINFFIVLGLFWLRYRKPDAPRPFKGASPSAFPRLCLGLGRGLTVWVV